MKKLLREHLIPVSENACLCLILQYSNSLAMEYYAWTLHAYCISRQPWRSYSSLITWWLAYFGASLIQTLYPCVPHYLWFLTRRRIRLPALSDAPTTVTIPTTRPISGPIRVESPDLSPRDALVVVSGSSTGSPSHHCSAHTSGTWLPCMMKFSYATAWMNGGVHLGTTVAQILSSAPSSILRRFVPLTSHFVHQHQAYRVCVCACFIGTSNWTCMDNKEYIIFIRNILRTAQNARY